MTSPSLRTPGAVVVDLDGTLVHTVPARVEAWLEALHEAGIPASRAAVRLRIGMDGEQLAAELAQVAAVRIRRSRLALIDRHAGEAFRRRNTAPQPLPGASEFLRELDERAIPWAIATSSRREQVPESIAALRLGVPPTVIDAATVRAAKPAPDLLLAAARALGVPPGSCWSLGDSVWDIEAAKAAGMVSIAVSAGSTLAHRVLADAGADVAVRTLAGVVALLDLAGRHDPPRHPATGDASRGRTQPAG